MYSGYKPAKSPFKNGKWLATGNQPAICQYEVFESTQLAHNSTLSATLDVSPNPAIFISRSNHVKATLTQDAPHGRCRDKLEKDNSATSRRRISDLSNGFSNNIYFGTITPTVPHDAEVHRATQSRCNCMSAITYLSDGFPNNGYVGTSTPHHPGR